MNKEDKEAILKITDTIEKALPQCGKQQMVNVVRSMINLIYNQLVNVNFTYNEIRDVLEMVCTETETLFDGVCTECGNKLN